jgi:hypothetical protein
MRVRMIRIRCVNRNCTSPEGIFEIDENEFGAEAPAKSGEDGARQYIIKCPFCGTENLVWMKTQRAFQKAAYGADFVIVKKEPQDFR